MCGIVGGVTSETKSDFTKFVKALLMIDSIRGMDSTGLAKIKDNNVDIFKKAVHGLDFIELLPNNMETYAAGNTAYIGHNRAATRGMVNSRNAHPFEHGDITLVHNGTLSSFKGLNSKFTVDSEAICSAMNEKAAKEVLEDLDGAYALVWHDKEDNSVCFARNSQRPLSFAKVKGKDTLYWASESMMLELVANHLKVDLEEIYELPEGKMWWVNMEAKKVAEDWMEEDFKVYVRPTYTHQQHKTNTRGYRGGRLQSLNGIKIGERIVVDVALKDIPNVVNFRAPVPGVYSVGKQKYNIETWWLDATEIEEMRVNLQQGKRVEGRITSIPDGMSEGVQFIIGDISFTEKKTSESFTTNAPAVAISPTVMVGKYKKKRLLKKGCAECGAELTENTAIWWMSDYPVCKDCDDAMNKAAVAAGVNDNPF